MEITIEQIEELDKRVKMVHPDYWIEPDLGTNNEIKVWKEDEFIFRTKFPKEREHLYLEILDFEIKDSRRRGAEEKLAEIRKALGVK